MNIFKWIGEMMSNMGSGNSPPNDQGLAPGTDFENPGVSEADKPFMPDSGAGAGGQGFHGAGTGGGSPIGGGDEAGGNPETPTGREDSIPTGGSGGDLGGSRGSGG